jgi:hypothetical protein
MTIMDHGYDSLIATSIAISILTELPNVLVEYPQMPLLHPFCKDPCLPLH